MRYAVVLVLLIVLMVTPFSCESPDVRLASKAFTESVILGEVLAHLARSDGKNAVHFRQLGGTTLVYTALKNGDVDAYVDYTGTIVEEIFSGQTRGDDAIRARLREDGILVSRSLGFNNRYEIGMKRDRAEQLGIEQISDLAKHPDLRFGFSNEFMDRKDGWQPLQRHYGLPQKNVRGVEHAIAYEQLEAGTIDVMDVYTTDAKIRLYDIKVLDDDRQFFPRYDAVILHRADLERRHPGLVEAFLRLEGRIDASRMMAMNRQATLNRVPETEVAAEFLKREFDIQPPDVQETTWTRLTKHTLEHVDLVRKSLLPAILVAIPLGILAMKSRRAGQVVLACVAVVQTIPALALLVFLMAPVHALGLAGVGQGSMTAVVALFLYSLLPIVRNTYAGLDEISPGVHESAVALGMSPFARLRVVEIPLASRTILAGIKTAAVVNVGFATLGALIGAGGYGQPILTGIRLNNTALILEGAVPAAAMALLIQWSFDVSQRWLVPRGLLLESES